MSNIFYKIRHKKTWLFYQPHKHGNIQLSKTGKIYSHKPSIKVYKDTPVVLGFGNIGSTRKLNPGKEIHREFRQDDWEVVAYQVEEFTIAW